MFHNLQAAAYQPVGILLLPHPRLFPLLQFLLHCPQVVCQPGLLLLDRSVISFCLPLCCRQAPLLVLYVPVQMRRSSLLLLKCLLLLLQLLPQLLQHHHTHSKPVSQVRSPPPCHH